MRYFHTRFRPVPSMVARWDRVAAGSTYSAVEAGGALQATEAAAADTLLQLRMHMDVHSY